MKQPSTSSPAASSPATAPIWSARSSTKRATFSSSRLTYRTNPSTSATVNQPAPSSRATTLTNRQASNILSPAVTSPMTVPNNPALTARMKESEPPYNRTQEKL